MAELTEIIQESDVIIDETKVTAGYFTGNLGTLSANNLVTASKSATQKNYYYDLQYSSEDQFSVAYGHKEASGSGAVNETKAIYNHFKNLLLDPDDIAGTSSDGFQFGVSSSAFNRGIENDMYFIVADRARMKDKLNAKNFTIQLSGSTTHAGMTAGATSASILKLTDDSATVTGTSTVAGIRYNVVSGSDGSAVVAATTKNYGYFYPDMGIIALRAGELSASLTGNPASVTASNLSTLQGLTVGAAAGDAAHGLAQELTTDGTADNALKLAQSLILTQQKLRSEELQKSKSYFIRAFANDYNFSNNVTFVSGSEKRIRHDEMIGYPSTFITTVGLYQNDMTRGGEPVLVAVGKLSGPVEKNYGTEATIKVKLTY
jgi:hypothetical protein